MNLDAATVAGLQRLAAQAQCSVDEIVARVLREAVPAREAKLAILASIEPDPEEAVCDDDEEEA